MISARLTPAAVLLLMLASCGKAERSAVVTDPPSAAPPAATSTPPPPVTSAPPPAAAPPPAPTGTTPPPPATATGEAQPGGAGDEEPIRQPARFVVAAGDVTPASVAVAPFLPVALTVVNRDTDAHRVRLVGSDAAFVVAAGASVERRLPGLRAGLYALLVDDGRAAASLAVGDVAGP